MWLHVSIICSCLLLSSSSLYEYTTIVLSIHMLIHIWVVSSSKAIITKAAMNIVVLFFCGHVFSFLLGKYLRVDFLGQRANV